MLVEHRGERPRIHPTAYIAPTATVSGDVTIGENTRVLFGAVLTAEGGPIVIGKECIIMENAVLRGTRKDPLSVGDHVLVGPRAYLTGCTVERDVFLATGATVFNGSTIGEGAEVRINGVVHLKTKLPPHTTVPIAWVAVGDPVLISPPEDHNEIWRVQETLNFPQEIFGVERPEPGKSKMPEVARRYTKGLASHLDDKIISDTFEEEG